MRTMFRTMPLVAALAILAGCATPRTAPAPGPISPEAVEMAKSRWPGSTAQTLDEGRTIFVNSCGKCHGHPDRSAYSESEWPPIMERMGKKARLSAEQTELVLHFILATRTSG